MLVPVALVRTDVTEMSEDDILHHRSLLQLLATAVVPSSPILVTPMIEVIPSSETSVLTRAT
jgi:hypothetical protein